MRRGQFTFISGGVRSGKSAFAEAFLVRKVQSTGRLVYIASGLASDSEMEKRIERHQQDRADQQWFTIEQPTAIEQVLTQIELGDWVLWDCLTTWVDNELFAGWETGVTCFERPGCFEQKVRVLWETIDRLLQRVQHLVIVSNEVLDDWPQTDPVMTGYRRWMGKLHQQLVEKAHTAIEMDYGVAHFWKGEEWHE